LISSIEKDILIYFILFSIDRPKIQQVYADLRKASMVGGGVPMTVRHVESILRMAEANARMHLRDYVRDEDVNVAVRVMLHSFINAQKFSISRAMHKNFRKYITYKKDNNELLFHILQHLVKDAVHYQQLLRGQEDGGVGDISSVKIDCEAFESKARVLDVHDLKPFYQSSLFTSNHFQLDQKHRCIIKHFV